ncbi:MAG: hypothetical protein HQL72_07145 [Magnetococcales bacterium]|nr:hypothetical protein [Magnetococcales bacterium]
MSNELSYQMTQSFSFATAEIPPPMTPLTPFAGGKGAVGTLKGSAGLGTLPTPDKNSLLGAIGGTGKGSAGLGTLPTPDKNSLLGAAGGTGKGKAGLGFLSSPKWKAYSGAAGKGKGGVTLLPGYTATGSSGSFKTLLAGTTFLGVGSTLPGLIGYAGPAGLLPSVAVAGVGFGTGFLVPVILAGALLGVVTPHARKSTNSPSRTASAPRPSHSPSLKPETKSSSPEATPLTKSSPWLKPGDPKPDVGYRATVQPSPPFNYRPASSKKSTKNPHQTPVYHASDNRTKKRVSRPLMYDRRFALRISVPRGALVVKGVQIDGQLFQSNARDVSMHGIRFHAPKYKVKTVHQLLFPEQNITLTVTDFTLHRQKQGDAVIVLSTFENGPDGWIKWIELITRLDRK